ncbi:coilin [Brachyistius frenatus]|uniref:coilin n=1 Tax=Brachyistius frenatus TaxID=100188 RepID=UPI0037E758AF
MAALPSSSSIRLRLHFDYPPPAAVGCRMCWLLVDLNTCRVVADLESIIREKFEFSRRSLVNLFVEDCYLPHTESIYVVRDNDSVRVKVDSVAQVNGQGGTGPEPAGEIHWKRRRASEEEEEEGVSTEWKKKKRKVEGGATKVSGDSSNRKSPGKHKEKKKKKKKKKKKVVEEKEEEKVPAAAPKPAAAPTTSPKKSTQTPPVSRAPPHRASSSSSSDSSSSSEEDDAPKTTVTKTPPSTHAAPKTPPSTKPTQTKPRPPSSSSDSGSSSDETASVKAPPTTTPPTPVESRPAPAAPQPSDGAQKPTAGAAEARSDSEEEIQLVIRRPLQPPPRGGGRSMGRGWRGAGPGPGNRGRGWRGPGPVPGPGNRGRSGGRGGVRWSGSSLESGCNGAGEPSYHTDTLTNTSVVLQTEAPQQDYSSMPLLAAPPPVGQKIAFKLLELTENYTPQVSEYKEGTIVSFDPTSKQIQLDLLHTSAAPVGPGKFDLVYQNPDGSDRVEYAVSRGASVTERWDSLLEPRLIIST